MDKILISACLLGEKVRYDGTSNELLHTALQRWQTQHRVVTICPEVAGGLSVPRAPAEINPNTQRVITQQGLDLSAEFMRGAQRALTLCQAHNIHYALLKESSPSCGSTRVHDGKFQGNKIPGMGMTARLLTAHGIAVYSEQNIEQLIQCLPVK